MNKFSSMMLAELHPLENHSSLFVFQPQKFHRYCGRWICFHHTKNYLFIHLWKYFNEITHNLYIYVEGKRSQCVYFYYAHEQSLQCVCIHKLHAFCVFLLGRLYSLHHQYMSSSLTPEQIGGRGVGGGTVDHHSGIAPAHAFQGKQKKDFFFSK